MSLPLISTSSFQSEAIRVRGIVQGVGFRPTVWRLAKQFSLTGTVCNDGDGVLIEIHGSPKKIDKFVSTLRHQCPPLSHIDTIERVPLKKDVIPLSFSISESEQSQAHTHLPADAACCSDCIDDIKNPHNRRYQYAFTNCTHCGPRLSIIQGIPYDRAQTTMSDFKLCDACLAEYNNPADRRFHAQPNACPDCGPQLWLEREGNKYSKASQAISEAAIQLKSGKIVAIKGVAGIHLAVDATNEAAILTLRQRKQRPSKPLALMAKDLSQIEQYCLLSLLDKQHLLDVAAPIVLLERKSKDCRLSSQLAPKQSQLGFMLPYSPLHHLLMQALDHPIVLTSGNCSNEPQCIDNKDATLRLKTLADTFLLHDRAIENRLDDSVLREMAGEHRLLRRARGYAPHPIKLAADFATAPDILAMGGELKNTFCLFKDQHATLSQHMGDLENYATYADYQKNLQLYSTLYQHQPQAIVVDKHPEYLSTKLGKIWAKKQDLAVIEVQHHHAHIAACLAENQQPLHTPVVLGIVLDGLGYGDDDSLWGGEFLLANYHQSKRLASLMPVPLLGGSQAMREPWRNTYAHLKSCGLWDEVVTDNLDIIHFLQQKPLRTLDQMMTKGINSPLASSCGRLFDAVAAAIGICTEQISYEGQAAIEMEALLAGRSLEQIEPYPFALEQQEGISRVSPRPMWQALFKDLANKTPRYLISARFHCGLANCLVKLSLQLVQQHRITQVVLTGGVFQNKTLFEAVHKGLEGEVAVLSHRLVPANDGGLSLGQVAIASAQLLPALN